MGREEDGREETNGTGENGINRWSWRIAKGSKSQTTRKNEISRRGLASPGSDLLLVNSTAT